jgi:hypothetical protein
LLAAEGLLVPRLAAAVISVLSIPQIAGALVALTHVGLVTVAAAAVAATTAGYAMADEAVGSWRAIKVAVGIIATTG